jgi:hypothetical protein
VPPGPLTELIVTLVPRVNSWTFPFAQEIDWDVETVPS